MQVSARILGQDYGVNAQEMNRILVNEGYLSGSPGNYTLTEKGEQFAEETSYYTGRSGWRERTFEDSIKDYLDVTPEKIEQARQEVADERTRKRAEREEESEFVINDIEKNVVITDTEKIMSDYEKAGLVILGIVAISCVIYKVGPNVKKWWTNRNEKSEGEINQ